MIYNATMSLESDCYNINQILGNLQQNTSIDYKMKTYGLRGGWKPYNSLDSFIMAKDMRLDGVQVDVWLSKD